MSENDRTLVTLAIVFAPLSLISFGGGPAVFAEVQRQAVVVHSWTTQREFVDLFAISRAAPGPGALLVTLIGWKAAGWFGAVVTSVAFFLPSALLAYGAARVWGRWRGQTWHNLVETGLAPVAAGLVLAGAVSILRAEPGGLITWGTALSIAVARFCVPGLHPLVLLSIGACIFAVADIFG